MKIPKLQFRLATVFVALTLCGMVMGVYRHYVYVGERIHYHSIKQGNASSGSLGMLNRVQVLQESRDALLAGDEDRLDELATRYRIGQPLEIAYVPVQLAAVDKAIADLKADSAHEEIIRNYHAQMIAEYEKSRWRLWLRVTEPESPPKSIHRSVQAVPLLGQ